MIIFLMLSIIILRITQNPERSQSDVKEQLWLCSELLGIYVTGFDKTQLRRTELRRYGDFK